MEKGRRIKIRITGVAAVAEVAEAAAEVATAGEAMAATAEVPNRRRPGLLTPLMLQSLRKERSIITSRETLSLCA